MIAIVMIVLGLITYRCNASHNNNGCHLSSYPLVIKCGKWLLMGIFMGTYRLCKCGLCIAIFDYRRLGYFASCFCRPVVRPEGGKEHASAANDELLGSCRMIRKTCMWFVKNCRIYFDYPIGDQPPVTTRTVGKPQQIGAPFRNSTNSHHFAMFEAQGRQTIDLPWSFAQIMCLLNGGTVSSMGAVEAWTRYAHKMGGPSWWRFEEGKLWTTIRFRL